MATVVEKSRQWGGVMALGIFLTADQAANHSSPRETKTSPSHYATPSANFSLLLSFRIKESK
jgi:hypothetical protein